MSKKYSTHETVIKELDSSNPFKKLASVEMEKINKPQFLWRELFHSKCEVMGKTIGYYDSNKVLWLSEFGSKFLPEELKKPLSKLKEKMLSHPTSAELEDAEVSDEEFEYVEYSAKIKVNFKRGKVTLTTFDGNLLRTEKYEATLTRDMLLLLTGE
jgi:hypothetical protein